MSVTTPTLKFLALAAALLVPLDVAAALDVAVEPPPPAAADELDELLLPQAASASVATAPTVHIPRCVNLHLTTDSSQSGKREGIATRP